MKRYIMVITCSMALLALAFSAFFLPRIHTVTAAATDEEMLSLAIVGAKRKIAKVTSGMGDIVSYEWNSGNDEQKAYSVDRHAQVAFSRGRFRRDRFKS